MCLFDPLLSYKQQSSQCTHTHTHTYVPDPFLAITRGHVGYSWVLLSSLPPSNPGEVYFVDPRTVLNTRLTSGEEKAASAFLSFCWVLKDPSVLAYTPVAMWIPLQFRKILHRAPMGNKVLKYCLMSRARLCPCHNILTELNDFLWALLGLLTTGWLSRQIVGAGMLKTACGFLLSICFLMSDVWSTASARAWNIESTWRVLRLSLWHF